LVRTVVLTDPGATPNRPDAADSDRVGPAACVTANEAVAAPDATTTLPLRAAPAGFTPALTLNDAPLPPPPPTTATSQSGHDRTDQAGPNFVTVVLTLPPCPDNDPDAGETDTVCGSVTDTVYPTGAGYAEAALRTWR
jgi:hypothetical protein